MTRFLITGASGFVGRHLLQELQRIGHEVVAVLRPGWQDKLVGLHKELEVIETTDLFAKKKDWWIPYLKNIDIVLHAAWYAEPGKYLTSRENFDCLSGTLNLAQAVAQSRVSRFVGLGTCAEYRTDNEVLTIASRLEPSTLYAAAKVSCYYMLRECFAQAGTSFLWCRLFHLHGEGEDERRLIAYLHKKLSRGEQVDLTSATQVRDFLEVQEASKQICAGALSQYQGAANICSGNGRTIRSIVEEIADLYDRRDLLSFGTRSDNLFDPAVLVGVPTRFN